MIDPVILIGEPLVFQKKLKIYPPRVKDVAINPNFNTFYKVLTMTQDDVKDEIGKKIADDEKIPTPFDFLIICAQYINGFSTLLSDAFNFFCHANIGFLFEEKKIIIENIENLDQNLDQLDQMFCLTEENFFDFQNQVRKAVGDKIEKPPEPEDPDEDPRVRRIKEKARQRDRIKARQANKDGISLSVCLVAICCMGIGLTPLNIGEMSYASIGSIMKMMQDKEKYDIDIRSLLAGADSKKIKPKYWIRNND